jgi:hypothetical protein
VQKVKREESEETMQVQVENHGSLFLFRPLDREAEDWIEERVPSEPWQWLGGALAVEHRYILGLIDGFRSEGGEVRPALAPMASGLAEEDRP